jgi:hypothetical protein
LSDPRKRTLRLVQQKLERMYALEGAPDVVEFVRTGTRDGRETLVLRQTNDDLEIALVLPAVNDPADLAGHHEPTDVWLQLVEGVSHFVYVAERARTELPATKLELELQAEVDKFVLLAFDGEPLTRDRLRALHRKLYEAVRYLHPAETEAGERYRLANDLAARFVTQLGHHDHESRARLLRRFYRAGQTEKIRLARAA